MKSVIIACLAAAAFFSWLFMKLKQNTANGSIDLSAFRQELFPQAKVHRPVAKPHQIELTDQELCEELEQAREEYEVLQKYAPDQAKKMATERGHELVSGQTLKPAKPRTKTKSTATKK